MAMPQFRRPFRLVSPPVQPRSVLLRATLLEQVPEILLLQVARVHGPHGRHRNPLAGCRVVVERILPMPRLLKQLPAPPPDLAAGLAKELDPRTPPRDGKALALVTARVFLLRATHLMSPQVVVRPPDREAMVSVELLLLVEILPLLLYRGSRVMC